MSYSKFFDPDMPLAMFTKERYGEYVLHLREMLNNNDLSINAYLRDLITTTHALMDEGYVQPFSMKAIKVDADHSVETYTEEELRVLLKRPEYQEMQAC